MSNLTPTARSIQDVMRQDADFAKTIIRVKELG